MGYNIQYPHQSAGFLTTVKLSVSVGASLAQQEAVLISRRWGGRSETADSVFSPKIHRSTESHRQPVHDRARWAPPECGLSLCKSRTDVTAEGTVLQTTRREFNLVPCPVWLYIFIIAFHRTCIDFIGHVSSTNRVAGRCKTPKCWARFYRETSARRSETRESYSLKLSGN